MSTAVKESRASMTKGDRAPEPSAYLRRVLDELDKVEQAVAPHEESPKRSAPATERAPRPFAYD